jgi:hypothetical protein
MIFSGNSALRSNAEKHYTTMFKQRPIKLNQKQFHGEEIFTNILSWVIMKFAQQIIAEHLRKLGMEVTEGW